MITADEWKMLRAEIAKIEHDGARLLLHRLINLARDPAIHVDGSGPAPTPCEAGKITVRR